MAPLDDGDNSGLNGTEGNPPSREELPESLAASVWAL